MLDTDATPPSGTAAVPAPEPDAATPVAVPTEPSDEADDWPDPPSAPTWWQRQEPWSSAALALAVIGLIPLTWEVPIVSLLAVAFALVGLHEHQLDDSRPNRWMAVVALFVGLATLALVVLATGFGKVSFLPFWTESPI